MSGGWRGKGRRDRRRGTGEFTVSPPSSPGSMLVLLVSGVLLTTAAAAAVFGGGFGDQTPHGRLLTTLERVAEAQEGRHQETGTFASWHETLPVEVPADVELQLLSGGNGQWQALVTAPDVGLSCSQSGRRVDDSFLREPPTCYRDEVRAGEV